MITLLYILAGAVILWVLRGFWPVPSFQYVPCHELEKARNQSSVKILDVRDASDYLHGHVPGSINISLGRLPYVWHKELSNDDSVIILSSSCYQSNKAARILHKRGFRQLCAAQGDFFQPTGKQVNTKGCGIFGHRYNH
ncbi:hypothetical protein CA600_05210 [Paenibacillus sp. VTT E-133280]|uniref:Rhodanese-like domain-containing protein n=3 Tax=Paenibacillaceae TaxID=186822 RepID=A0A7Z2VST6_9BACL|nr:MULTISPECIES: rhodanese-like domain-containing protein [Paenibacillaceae]MCK8487468.1 rhodanese-like domain-containing protein [Paenibacillus mellifer]MCT1400915.1 rhodanese-like domain-containing protein [Paenibacillus sp. p3-SID867]MEC0259847.1 rhodanese-like domain-containing protein [Paenibacillus lautus]OZQ68823.1 hypothetical protein CA600_05210 [Paenibacillus sp. VTT E-133280]QJD88561.1 rhodanese-like domain-containing protein [Cohnella herbarum]